MKLGVVSNIGSNKAIVDRVKGAVWGIQSDVDTIFVEHPLTPIPAGMKSINTCVGIQNLLINEELRQVVWNDLGLKQKPHVCWVFSLFNGNKFSDWLEVSYSEKFMNYEVGASIGFTMGAGFRVPDAMPDILPAVSKLGKFLQELNYHGEITLAIASDFSICDIMFGHNYGAFGLFTEISKFNSTSADLVVPCILEFMLGHRDVCELFDAGAVANIVSLPPFPFAVARDPRLLSAPSTAEKHIWRLKRVNMDYALITVYGSYMGEARKRLRRTLDNMVSYNEDLQYRTDYGFSLNFVIMQEHYNKFLDSPYRKLKEDVSVKKEPVPVQS